MSLPSFATAPQTYFTVANKQEAKQAFLDSTNTEPLFVYRDNYNLTTVSERLAQLDPTSSRHKSLELVKASIELQNNQAKLAIFRKINAELYQPPAWSNIAIILSRMSGNVTPVSSRSWQEALDRLESFEVGPYSPFPEPEVFNRYKSYLKRYLSNFPLSTDSSLPLLLDEELARTGLKQAGWQIRIKEGQVPARVHHIQKLIIVGKDYRVRSPKAAARIVIHEVYGHAIRGPQSSIAEAEGFAILLEQLVSDVFKFRRSYRYLAVALGWGADGQVRTFREVFEILYRLMIVGSKYTEDDAKSYAFDECLRAFRGGRPDIAGAVFLKDAVYFEANLKMWQILSDKPVCYNEFVDYIEGRAEVLK